MERRLISSGAPWERVGGYSRAVVAGHHVHVSGTVAVTLDGAEPAADVATQARRCFEIIFEALREAGARPEDVVRTRIYLTRPEDADDVIRVHGELFGEIRPASAMVVVRALIDRRYLVEVEADAVTET